LAIQSCHILDRSTKWFIALTNTVELSPNLNELYSFA